MRGTYFYEHLILYILITILPPNHYHCYCFSVPVFSSSFLLLKNVNLQYCHVQNTYLEIFVKLETLTHTVNILPAITENVRLFATLLLSKK